jgi:hypothetical protein
MNWPLGRLCQSDKAERVMLTEGMVTLQRYAGTTASIFSEYQEGIPEDFR